MGINRSTVSSLNIAFFMADLQIVHEKDGQFSGPRQVLLCGVRVTYYEPNFDNNFEEDLSQFETREDDIFIVTYPKSGEL